MNEIQQDIELDEARRFVDSKLGVIKAVVEARRRIGESHYFHYSCRLTNLERVLSSNNNPLFSTNASLNKKQCELSAIAEALERYCAVMKNYEDEQLYLSYNNKDGKNFIHPNTLPACSDSEYENPYNILSKPKENHKYYWTMCYDLINKKEIYVPSSFIYLQTTINSKSELITTPNSTGTAGGQTIEDATNNAILEGLEREAIMVTWLNQLPRHKIDLESINNTEILKRIDALEKLGNKVNLFDIRTDFSIPIIFCILQSKKYPYITTSAAAKLSPIPAIVRALDEAYSTRKFAAYNEEIFKERIYYKDYKNVIDFEDHLYLYNMTDMQKKLDFLVQSKEKISIDSLPQNKNILNSSSKQILEYFIKEFSKRNINLIVKDITTSDICNSSFKFVKMFSPELVWLTPNHNYRFLKNKRIKSCLPKMGFNSFLNNEITNLPHPFA
ncbi:MAG: YcaO-like family protein [Calditrichaceae bacterium]